MLVFSGDLATVVKQEDLDLNGARIVVIVALKGTTRGRHDLV